MTAPVETEIKLRLENAEEGRDILRRLDFKPLGARLFEANTIYDFEVPALKQAGKLLRLRETGDKVILTYKGPVIPGPLKSRPEIEVFVSDFQNAQQIIFGLGYQAVFRYEKYRTEFARGSEAGLVVVDETPIGCFFEIEGQAEWIHKVAAEMGFHNTDYLNASYSSLYQQHCQMVNCTPSNMIFSHY